MVDTILESATRVFDDEGITGTTNRIAELAGISIGSLYQYFPNKESILAQLALQHLRTSEAALIELLDRFDAGCPSREAMAAEIVETVVELNGHHPRAHAAMREHAPRTKELTAEYTAFTEVVVHRIIPHLIRTGTPPSDAPLRARLLIASVDGQVHQLIGDTSTAAERAALTAAITAGLLPHP
ncbi:TetR/AcrR family transcriptional regulator [Williamsia sp.]|uniref:TetR/AcrR family transcriptional regulator n=1 Tax=Williamsia sp. TaxID=1872085 RepID=UPI002F956F0C